METVLSPAEVVAVIRAGMNGGERQHTSTPSCRRIH